MEKEVNVSTFFAGERYDFVIEANNIPGAYWIQVRGLGECGIKRAQQLGILRYARGPYQPSSPPPTYDIGIPQGVVSSRMPIVHIVTTLESGINSFFIFCSI